MDCALGLVGKGYVMLVTDTTQIRSIVAYKHDEDKIVKLAKRKALATAGEQCDRVAFGEYIQKNLALHGLKTDLELSNHATANFIRKQLASSLRSRQGAYSTFCLYGGVDEEGPALYYLDYLGSLQKTNFAAHGYSSYFALSVFDLLWKENMTIEEGKDLMKKCVEQLKLRFLVNMPHFMLKVVTADGITEETI